VSEDSFRKEHQVSPVRQPLAGARPDDSWSPDRTAALLKAALYISVVAAGWLVLRSSVGGEVGNTPDSEIDEPNPDDYSPWEPAS
jgi:hypothetical protein